MNPTNCATWISGPGVVSAMARPRKAIAGALAVSRSRASLVTERDRDSSRSARRAALARPPGMLMGNAIAATVMAARRTFDEIAEHRAEVEVRLSLGIPGPVAVRPYVGAALPTAITPQVEQTKIVGLVALPGTMTGLLPARTRSTRC